jgi:hypothetical protein
MITNALSVDVEEYYHAEIFRAGTSGLRGKSFESRVERCIDRLLTLLEEHSTRGTFFVLGEIAERHPNILRRMAAAGHEIGCHGDRHESVSRLTPSEFRADVRTTATVKSMRPDSPTPSGTRARPVSLNFQSGPSGCWA